MTSCPCLDDLQRLLARNLDEDVCAGIELHIEGCQLCQNALEQLTVFDAGKDLSLQSRQPEVGQGSFWRHLKEVSSPIPGSPARPEPPAGLFRVPNHDSREDSDQRALTKLLRRRLPVAYFASAVVLGISLLICSTGAYGDLLGPLGEQLTAGTFGPRGEALLAMTVASLAGSAFFLWIRPTLSAAYLRGLESANFSIMVLLFTFWHFHLLLAQPPNGFEGQAHQDTWILYGNFAGVFNWILLMTLVALFLPQTPGRCTFLMMVQIIAASAATLAAARANMAVARTLPVLLSENAQILVSGAAVCIYSTVKARAMEREVRAARREARDLGQYRLKQLLGRGGMGEVYLAEHRLLKRPCAVKVIHPEKTGDSAVLQRFEREVRATAGLRHPNTVEVFDFGRADDGTFYYVMEYLDGLSLDRLVKHHGPLPAARVIHLVRQLCGALREAHATGLIHRDIKPGNVVVCRSGPPDRAKLLDFGLVRSTQPNASLVQLTQDQMLGTPGYMAPEQIEGAESVDHRSDLYSLGAVTFFLLTGRGPFERDTTMRTLVAHLHDSAPRPSQLQSNIPPDLEAVVLRCLNKEAASRYTSAAELDQALAGCKVDPWTEDNASAWWGERSAESA